MCLVPLFTIAVLGVAMYEAWPKPWNMTVIVVLLILATQLLVIFVHMLSLYTWLLLDVRDDGSVYFKMPAPRKPRRFWYRKKMRYHTNREIEMEEVADSDDDTLSGASEATFV